MKTCRRHQATNPELDERRMLWIQAKVGTQDVGNAGADVIRLIESEIVQPRRKSGTSDCSTHEKQKKGEKETTVSSHQFSTFSRNCDCGLVHKHLLLKSKVQEGARIGSDSTTRRLVPCAVMRPASAQ